MKRFLGILILLLGQAFIVAAMLLLPHGLEQNIMILDTVVLSIIWWVFSFDLIRPIISEGDHAPEIGSLGIRWKGQLLYAFLAIVFGILAAYYSLKFEYQLLGQGGLFGILVLTWLFSLMAKRKVSEVAAAETKALDGRAQMKIAVREVPDALFDSPDAPDDIRRAIEEIEGQLRYITPCSNPEALAYEQKFIQLAHEIAITLPHAKMEGESLRANVARLQRTLAQRKSILN